MSWRTLSTTTAVERFQSLYKLWNGLVISLIGGHPMNDRLRLCLRYGVMNLVMWLLLFSALVFLGSYLQEPGMMSYIEP